MLRPASAIVNESILLPPSVSSLLSSAQSDTSVHSVLVFWSRRFTASVLCVLSIFNRECLHSHLLSHVNFCLVSSWLAQLLVLHVHLLAAAALDKSPSLFACCPPAALSECRALAWPWPAACPCVQSDGNDSKFAGQHKHDDSVFVTESEHDICRFAGESEQGDFKCARAPEHDNSEVARESEHDDFKFTGESKHSDLKFAGESEHSDFKFAGESEHGDFKFKGEFEHCCDLKFTGESELGDLKFAGESEQGDFKFTGESKHDLKFTGESHCDFQFTGKSEHGDFKFVRGPEQGDFKLLWKPEHLRQFLGKDRKDRACCGFLYRSHSMASAGSRGTVCKTCKWMKQKLLVYY